MLERVCSALVQSRVVNVNGVYSSSKSLSLKYITRADFKWEWQVVNLQYYTNPLIYTCRVTTVKNYLSPNFLCYICTQINSADVRQLAIVYYGQQLLYSTLQVYYYVSIYLYVLWLIFQNKHVEDHQKSVEPSKLFQKKVVARNLKKIYSFA